MNLAEISNGVVVNTIAVDPDNIPDWASGWPEVVGEFGVGDTYDTQTKTFIKAPKPPVVVTPEQVKAERDERMSSGFVFNVRGTDYLFQSDPGSMQNITGAATLAGFAIMAGSQPGDLLWANPDRPFAWITADNSVVSMDAHETFAMGKVAAAHRTGHIFASKALSSQPTIPVNYTDDANWPGKKP